MGNTAIKGVTMVREGIKATIGKDRYSKLVIYTNKLKTGYNVKVQQLSWARLTGEEVTKIKQYIQDKYNVQVTVKEGCSGSRNLGFVSFYI